MTNSESSRSSGSLEDVIWPAYLVGLAVLLFAAIDLFGAVRPIDLGTPAWRFGAAGLLSGSVVTPLLAILVIYAVACRFEHSTIKGLVGILSAVLGSVLLLSAAIVVFDGLELREQVQRNAENTFEMAMLRGTFKLAVGGLIYYLLAYTSLTGYMRSRRAARSNREEADQSLLVTG